MGTHEVTGVILAAGKGTRMQPFSNRYPKPLLPICNRPLIEYQIEEMKMLGIMNILIVIGHLGHEIIQALGTGSRFGVNIRYIPQKETMGIAHALGELEEYLNGPFLLFLGDIFFLPKQLEEILKLKNGANAVLAVSRGESPEVIRRNFAIVLNKDNTVKRVIEKPRFPPNDIKGCGLYLFNESVFDAIRRTPRTAARDEYEITESIQILINDNLIVRVAEVVVFDINLTSPYDLLTCNLKQLSLLKRDSIIGKDCAIHKGAKISNSIIGNGVTVRKPLNIRNSLIFTNTEVDFSGEINNIILTNDEVIDCRFVRKGE